MSVYFREDPYPQLSEELKIDCAACSGLCCTALYFSKSEGFPTDKLPGTPCRNLREDFRCGIHTKLAEKGLHGCMAFDCFGAGQLLTRRLAGETWRSAPQKAQEIYDAFLALLPLRQALWYLTEAACWAPAHAEWTELDDAIKENLRLTALAPRELSALDLHTYHAGITPLLHRAAEAMNRAMGTKIHREERDFLGRNLSGKQRSGQDFSMQLLIAANLSGCKPDGANFLAADLRDCDLRGADLSHSLYLTQGQLNAAKTDQKTMLPPRLSSPLSR